MIPRPVRKQKIATRFIQSHTMSSQTIHPSIMIVTGYPCAGKTTIARRLAEAINYPLLTKDDVKERLFDALGCGDRAWSDQLSTATYSILFYVLESQVEAGQSVIVEANFRPQSHSDRFARLQRDHDVKLVQIHVSANADTIEQRLHRRTARKNRHPGHLDDALEEELPDKISEGRYDPLEIESECIEVDTSDSSVETTLSRVLKQLNT